MSALTESLFSSPEVRAQKALLVLAPMAGITDPPTRRIAYRMGANLTVSEMVASQALLRGTAESLRLSTAEREAGPLVVQIAGADPEMMAEAARQEVRLGAEMIDINMGCPVRKIVKSGSGAALLQNPPLARRVLEAVAEAVSVPVSVKIRLGWDCGQRTGLEIARAAQECGLAWVAVHGRTRSQMYQGEADWNAIGEIKGALSIPVIGNGDLRTPQEAQERLHQTGVDGLMIGRASLGRPWIFRRIAHLLSTGALLPSPPVEERMALAREHLLGLVEFYGETGGVRLGRKHLAWYARGLVGCARFREQVQRLSNLEEMLALLDGFFSTTRESHATETEPEEIPAF
ncbi:MAG: tRNA dihydrouridine synthase DusB [Magnetococcales bacterium]|nr:tRNA dihydrouridine synthase DusB [Magnetococcales bacterium]